MRTAARHTRLDVRQLRLQEQETADLRISDLRRWQKVLDVPLSELLEEPDDELANPVKQRAKLVRIMKTATALLEEAKSPQWKRANQTRVERMAETLVGQLTDLMPELDGVSPWHTYGQRRSLQEYGRIVESPVQDSADMAADPD